MVLHSNDLSESIQGVHGFLTGGVKKLYKRKKIIVRSFTFREYFLFYLLSQGFENPDFVLRDWLAIMMLFYHFSSTILGVELKTVALPEIECNTWFSQFTDFKQGKDKKWAYI